MSRCKAEHPERMQVLQRGPGFSVLCSELIFFQQEDCSLAVFFISCAHMVMFKVMQA